MAKAFDLVHKVNTAPKEEESRIPFDEDDKPKEEKPKRKVKVEMAFFYALLFIVFFVIGASVISPSFLASLTKESSAEASPSPQLTPQQGLVIEQEGNETKDASPVTKSSPSVSPKATTSPKSSPSTATSTAPSTAPVATTPAKIQVLNGTNRTGAADALRSKLAAADIVVASIGNYKSRSVQKTTIYHKPGFVDTANKVQAVSGGIISETSDGIGSYDVLVVIGATN